MKAVSCPFASSPRQRQNFRTPRWSHGKKKGSFPCGLARRQSRCLGFRHNSRRSPSGHWTRILVGCFVPWEMKNNKYTRWTCVYDCYYILFAFWEGREGEQFVIWVPYWETGRSVEARSNADCNHANICHVYLCRPVGRRVDRPSTKRHSTVNRPSAEHRSTVRRNGRPLIGTSADMHGRWAVSDLPLSVLSHNTFGVILSEITRLKWLKKFTWLHPHRVAGWLECRHREAGSPLPESRTDVGGGDGDGEVVLAVGTLAFVRHTKNITNHRVYTRPSEVSEKLKWSEYSLQNCHLNSSASLVLAAILVLANGGDWDEWNGRAGGGRENFSFPRPSPLSSIRLSPTPCVALLYSSQAFSVPKSKMVAGTSARAHLNTPALNALQATESRTCTTTADRLTIARFTGRTPRYKYGPRCGTLMGCL